MTTLIILGIAAIVATVFYAARPHEHPSDDPQYEPWGEWKDGDAQTRAVDAEYEQARRRR